MYGNDWLYEKAVKGRGATGKYVTVSGVGGAFAACCVVALSNAAITIPFWIIDPPQLTEPAPPPPKVSTPDPVTMLKAMVRGIERNVELREAAFRQVVELQHLYQVPDAEFEAVLQKVWRAKHPRAPEPWLMKPLAWRKEVEWNVSEVSLTLIAQSADLAASDQQTTP